MRLGLRLLILAGLLLTDLAVGSLLLDDGTPADRRLENSPAAAYDQERVAAIQRDSDGTRFVLVDGLWRLAPVSSELVNVGADHRRSTIGGRKGGVRVAFSGGSAAFGVGQADGSTIPSVLASLLNEGDVPVEVVSLATPAWTSYDVAQDLRAQLQGGERFDVVVVYAGVNEVALAMLGGRVPTTMIGVFDEAAGRASSGFFESWADRSAVARLAGRPPRRAATPIRLSEAWGRPVSASAGSGGDGVVPSMAGSRMVEDAVFNYVEGDRLLRELAAEYGFTLVQVVQPARPSGRSPLYQFVVGEYGRAVEGLLDLSDLLPDRCFFDSVHTTEPCSPQVAEAIRAELAPLVAAAG